MSLTKSNLAKITLKQFNTSNRELEQAVMQIWVADHIFNMGHWELRLQRERVKTEDSARSSFFTCIQVSHQ